jgi:hypothetical protein
MSISKQASSLFKGLYKKASKNMSGKMVGSGLLYNKWVLYTVFLLSLLNLLVWLVAGDIMNAVVFLLIGFLTSFFSKNMVVILIFALVVSNVLKFGLSIGQEGFAEGADKEEEVDGFEEGADKEEEVDGFAEGVDKEEEAFEEGADKEEEGEGFEEGAEKKEEEVDGFTEGAEKEGMHNLGYSSVVPTAMFEQQTLFSNLQKMSPLVINADNEAKIRTQLKYESFVLTR